MKIIVDIPDTLKQIADDEDIETFSHIVWNIILMDAIKNSTVLPNERIALKNIWYLMRGLYEEMNTGGEHYTTKDVYEMLENEAPTIFQQD